jgi:hypothetical protein
MGIATGATIAQSSSLLAGARAAGMGYATSCNADVWSLMNNVAGLAEVKRTTASASYNSHPYVKSFNRSAAVFALPVGKGAAGLGLFRFGDDLYNEQVLSAGFGNRFGLASLGLKLNYVQYAADGFGSRGVFTVNFGGIATLTPKLMLGAYITNINQPSISSGNEKEKIPTRMAAGLGLKPSDKVLLTTELEKDLDADVIWKTGLEYQFHQKFFFRTGFNLNPDAVFMGTGFSPRNFGIDYAMHYDLRAGLNHHVTATYRFLKK